MSFWLCNIARTSIGSSLRNNKRSSLRITSAMASTLQPAKKFKYVVLGGGVSAGYAAREFQSHGIDNEQVAIVSANEELPYERPALSKGFLKPEKPARLPGFHTCVGGGGEKQDAMWYVQNGIKFIGRTTIEKVEFDAKRLSTDRGTFIEYDKLILATGCRAIKIDLGEKEGEVLYLRDHSDASVLYDRLSSLPEESNVVLMGGGYIGTEVGASVLDFKHKLTLVVPSGKFVDALFTDRISKVYMDAFKKRGAEIVVDLGEKVIHDASGKLTGLKLKSGKELPADTVIAGIGAKCNLDLFEDKLETTQGGLKVDGRLQTSAPDVYAAGDIAAFPLKMDGGRYVRQEHVQNARDSSAHAVRSVLASNNVCEPPGDYDYLPYFYSRLLNFSWKCFGVNQGDTRHFGEFSEGKTFGAFWIRDGQIVGTFLETASDEEHDKMRDIAMKRPRADDLEGLLKEIFGRSMPLVD